MPDHSAAFAVIRFPWWSRPLCKVAAVFMWCGQRAANLALHGMRINNRSAKEIVAAIECKCQGKGTGILLDVTDCPIHRMSDEEAAKLRARGN